MKSFRDLDIYVESKRLAIEVHKESLKLPKFELYEEGSQVRRSSKAVSALIVEGYGRKKYKADFIKYLIYALAECDETIIHLEFLIETDSTKDRQGFEKMITEYHTLSKRLNTFITWATTNWNTSQTGN